MSNVTEVLWAAVAVVAVPVLVVATVAMLTLSTPMITRRLSAAVATLTLTAEVGDPITRWTVVSLLTRGPLTRVALVVSVAILVGVVTGIVWTERRNEAFLAEWAAYVTAENEGRPAPTAPPRFAQVARSLQHNRRADWLRARQREHPGVGPGAWRDTGAVEGGWLLLAVTALVSLAAAVSNAAVGRWSVVVPAGLAALLSGWMAVTGAVEDRQSDRVAGSSSPGPTTPVSGLCESCHAAAATAHVVFPDGEKFTICSGCGPAPRQRAMRRKPDSRPGVAVFRRVGGGPR